MNRFEAVLRRIALDLTAIGAPWAVVGGLAVSARTEPRFTRDVDVVVAVLDDAAAETFVDVLVGRGYRLGFLTEQDAVGRLATARLIPDDSFEDAVVVDILLASSGIEPETADAATPVELIPGLTVPVAQLGHLIALKLLARDDETRPQDRSDLRALLSSADDDDLRLAARAVRLVGERGFDRGRDLVAALAELVDSRSPDR